MVKPMELLGSIIHGGGKGLLNVKLPTFSLSQGFASSQYTSLGGITNSVVDSAENLLRGAKLLYCLGAMIINPAMMLGMLSVLANSILAAATDMAGRLADLARGQINQALGQICGSINNLVGNIFSFLGSILDLYQAIKDFYDAICDIGLGDWEFFMAEEDCEYIFSAIAACMLNKFLGEKIQALEHKISSKIIETGNDLNSAVADSLADVNTVSSYVERETFLMNKATKQLNGISNIVK